MLRSRTTDRRRSWFIGLGTTALVVALAGCGGPEDTPGIATAAEPGVRASSSPAAATGVVAEYVEAQRNWVACLRERGFQVPDPDPRGRVDLRAPGVPKKDDPKWMDAQKSCAKYTVPMPEEVEDKPVLTAEEIGYRRAYARCVRENGVPDFPDPGPDGQWPNDNGASGSAISDQQAAAQARASQICEPVQRGLPSTTPNPNPSGRG